MSRRADQEAADAEKSRLRRWWHGVKRKLDPRNAARKRVGDVEVPPEWPLGAALFLVGCVIAVVTGSALALAAVLVAAVVGLVWLLRRTA